MAYATRAHTHTHVYDVHIMTWGCKSLESLAEMRVQIFERIYLPNFQDCALPPYGTSLFYIGVTLGGYAHVH